MQNKSLYKIIAHIFGGIIFSLSLGIYADEIMPTILPDPTKPFDAKVESVASADRKTPVATDYLLQAIVTRGDKHKAMINGMWVIENQSVMGAKVGKIDDKSVMLVIAGRSRELILQPTIMRQTTVSDEH